MRKTNRLLSALLTLCMVFSVFSSFMTLGGVSSSAGEGTATTTPTTTPTATATATPTGTEQPAASSEATKIRTEKYANAEQKLATMKLYLTAYGLELYALEATGEVAIKNVATGEILFSNPYDANAKVSSTATSSATPTAYELLVSQLIVDYTDLKGAAKQMCSFTSAAESDQIKVAYVKNGISVSYAIGRADSRRLCPMCVTVKFMEEDILPYIEDENDKVAIYPHRYYLYDMYSQPQKYTQDYIDKYNKLYSATKKMDIYALNEDASNYDKNKIEQVLKAWCPHITYETIEEQHTITEYEAKAAILPCFRMSLIYRIDENGLEIMLPANSITFNEDYYTLKTITVLPYFGAGNNADNGFTFIPDGTGSIIEFKDVQKSAVVLTGTLYGADYSYHTLPTSFTGKNEQMRFPVFGVVDEKPVTTRYFLDDEGNLTDIVYCAHKYEEVVTAPTCTEKGYTTATCTLCSEGTPGHVIIKDETEPAHTYDENVPGSIEIDPTTCVHLGHEKYVCTVCGDVKEVVATEYAEHSYVGSPVEGLPGITRFTCSVCGDYYETVHASHTMNKVATIEAECTAGDYKNLNGNVYIYESGKLTLFVRAADILKFAVGKTVTLKDGTTGTVSFASIIPISKDKITALTDSAAVKCNGMVESESERYRIEVNITIGDVSAVSESNGAMMYSLTKTLGQGYSLYYCAECGYSEKRDFTYDTHTYKADSTKTVKANCATKTDGKVYYYCEDCGAERIVTTAWTHTWPEKQTSKSQTWVDARGNIVDSTSFLAKYQLLVFTCSVCGETTEKLATCKDDAIGNETHVWDDGVVISEGDCTHYRKTQYTCLLCKKTKVEDATKYVHSFTKTVVEPTCTTRGYTHFSCSICGLEYDGDYIEPKHTFVETVYPYTCTTDGYTHFRCSVCGYEYDGDVTPAAHRFVEVSRTEADCSTETNGVIYYECSECGETKQEEIPWAHEWSKTIIVETATATTDGERYSFCTKCFKENHEPIPAFGTGGLNYQDVVTYKPSGYVAILTEGESFSTLTSNHGGALHPYSSTYITVNPRPSDEYNLADSLSVGTDAKWIVTSDRRYTGNYSMRIYMLSDGKDSEYAATIAGMAEAYRDYLIDSGALTALEEEESDIPLYIEALGATEVQTTILSFPVYRLTALTTFENLQTMSEDFKKYGITNINYKLTGFANGGINATIPNNVKYEGVVGGNSGYTDFYNYAVENGIGVFPEFDLSYSHATKLFDGFSSSKDAVKTIDDRYIIKKEYDPTYQMFQFTGLLAISPSVFDKYYTKLAPKMSSLGYDGISLSTLGTDLNSDFDQDDPYNREDDKRYVQQLLAKAQEDSNDNVMIDGGNAYAFQYVRHILNMATSSSKFLKSSASIPFIGMVLHGYINYTGTPTNESSNIDFEILKMIENGTNPYFVLCYDNTEALKEDEKLNEYYSIAYDIWMKNENSTDGNNIVDIYDRANEALGDVQYAQYEEFKYLIGERITTEQEAKEYEAEQQAELAKLEKAYNDAEKAFKNAQELYIRLYKEGRIDTAETYYDNITTTRDKMVAARKEYLDMKTKVEADIGYDDNGEYIFTDFTVNDKSIAYVEYSNGIYFVLNYNNFAVQVDLNGEIITVDAMDYFKATKN